ncbi:MAG: DNA-protecting protein DprA [Deltaproteobacteria bacterium]|nr:DNA-protecting protein DprA [Deltaproteobacteria bacterium]
MDNEISLIEKTGARVVAFTDPGYPLLLREIVDPPAMLYVKGELPDFGNPAVAVVGTRRPSHYGLKMSEVLARDLAYSGVTVVSGMARGCDAAAHKGALSAKGRTTAVLGTGVDVPYPRENAKLYEQILEDGAVISEQPMSTPPAPYNFPKRNRIISGLSLGVVVVEAPLRSGALQTARLALDYNRDVFAVPGQVTSPKSMGTNRLIKEGAMLVESAGDVLGALNITVGRLAGAEPTALKGDERVIWDSLKDAPAHIDAVISATGLSAPAAIALLLDMELRGLVAQRPGMCFLRRG